MKERERQPKSDWQKTQYANLVRFVPSRTLFARIKVRGKLIRQALETSDLEVGKRKLDRLAEQERGAADSERDGKMTFAQALERYRELGFRVTVRGMTRRKMRPLKQRSRDYYGQQIKALLKSWPGLNELPIRKVSENDCQKWADRFAEKNSPSSYNHTISILRHVLEVGVKAGARRDNPALEIGRMSERTKKLQLPSADQFERFVAEIEASGSGFSQPCADLVRFLAFGGLRRMEAANVRCEDVDFFKGTIRVYGDAVARTKNDEFRTVPMIADMRHLLERLKEKRPTDPPETPVMAVRECQKAMDRAAKRVGMKRITHHDLRHLFATRCIESGVDIPTVSRWLGHKDGGALAMRVYGHLRDEHSVAMAQRVTFTSTKAGNVITMPKREAV